MSKDFYNPYEEYEGDYDDDDDDQDDENDSQQEEDPDRPLSQKLQELYIATMWKLCKLTIIENEIDELLRDDEDDCDE